MLTENSPETQNNFYNLPVHHYLMSEWKEKMIPDYWMEKIISFFYTEYNNHQDQFLSSIPEKYQDLLRPFIFHLPHIDVIKKSEDGTVKFLMKFHDGKKVETVLIPFPSHYSICLSTQVGCGMKCSFCYTGLQGFERNLTAAEIIGQYLVARQWLHHHCPHFKQTILKIVFMGQGEPLSNFDSLKTAIHNLTHPWAMNLHHRHITVSTVGFLPGLKKWQELGPVHLALSLHSPFEHIRNELIPLNKIYPLENIIAEMSQLPLLKRQFFTIEYLLIKGVNDREEDAQELARVLKPLKRFNLKTKAWEQKAVINLIPYNSVPGVSYQRPDKNDIQRFSTSLKDCGLYITLRKTKGDDILAACGQLNSQNSLSLSSHLSQ